MPSWKQQKFSYGAGPTVFTPTYPAVKKTPVDALVAARHDTVAIAGDRQSITERIDAFQTLEWPLVPESELASWATFFQFALLGGAFDYYPDASSGTHASYQLEDTSWDPKWVEHQLYSFTTRLRRKV